ncbi:hypothetical protein OIU84_024650, partial [Salix udensis]
MATTIEKLFLQIFERKLSIFEQVKHQADLFDHRLASKCVLDGTTPPPWLLSPSLSSLPNELNKEDLISGLLLPRPHPANPYSSSAYSVQPVITTNISDLPGGSHTELGLIDKGFDSGYRQSVLSQLPVIDCGQCNLNGVPELEFSDTSPQDCRDARMPDIAPDHSQSLARIHRSKSRQKALELRNSVKTVDLEGLGVTSLQFDHVDQSESLKLVEASNKSCVGEEVKAGECMVKENSSDVYHGRSTRSRSSRQKASSVNESGNLCTSTCFAKEDDPRESISKQQLDHVDLSESLKLVEASTKSCVGEEVKAGECMVKENSSDVYHGRSTRSRSSRQKASSVNESGNLCTSTCFAKEDDPRESISKQQLVHVDLSESLKLVEASTKSCVGEEVKAGECMVKENSSDVYHGRSTRSRSSRQKASSVNESGNVCTSTCFAKEDDPRESISKQQLDHVDQSESLKLVEASTKSCVGEEVKAGECMVKENSSDVYHGRSTRSRSSRQKASSVNESGNVCTSTCFAKEDDPRESISKQQPNQVDLAELVSVVGHAISEAQMENEGNHRGNEMASIMYSGGVPRRTSSSPQPNSTKQPLDMNDSSYIDNRDSRIRESIGDPSLQPNCVKEISELAKPSYVISNDSYGRVKANVSDYWSKEMGSGLYSGRITRSRGSSQQADVANESLKLDGSCGNAEKEPRQLSNPVDDFRELVKPFNITDKSCGVNEKMLNYQNNEERADSYYGKISRNSNQQLGVDGLPILDTSSNTAKDNDGSLSHSFGRSSQPHQPLNQVREEGVDLQEVLDTQTNALPCIERRDIVDLGICDTVVAETDIDSDGIVEACSVTSRSNSDGSIRGMELSVSRPAIDSLMLVKPKQLDFDDLEDCSLNEIAGPASENKQQSLSSERRTSTLLHSTLILDKVNYQEKPILSVEMPLLEDQAVFSKEDKPWNDSSEAFVNETALFVVENNNSVHKKINSAISENQNGDCYVMGSWPQHKRRKIAGQLTSSSYASSSLMRKLFQPNVTDHVNGNMNTIEDPDTVQISEGFYMSHMGDDMQPNAIKSSVEDIHQTSGPHMVWPEFSSPKLQVEEIKPGLEGRSGSANKCGARSPSGLKKPSTGVSQGSSLEKVPRDNHTIVIFDETSQHTAEKNQVSLQLEDRFELGSSELLTCTETAMKEKRFHLERNGKSLSNSVSSPHSQSVDLIGTDMPVYEWFGMETEGIDFEKLDLSDSALESAIAVERLCKFVCLETPLSHFATAYNKHKTLNLYQSVPNGLLEVMELSTTVNTNSNTGKELEASSKCFNDKVNDTLHGRLYSDSPAFTNAPSTWDIRKPLMSPVGKLWEGITSRSGSSEKRVSSIPDLPCISEENENTIEVPETFKDVVGSEQMISLVKKGLLADITNNSDPPISVYDSEIVSDRYSLAYVSTEYSFTGTCRRDKLKHGNQKGNRRKCNSKVKENRNLVGVNGVKRARESHHNRLSKPILSGKTSLRKGGLSLAETRSKHNNIVSNITSFIPPVQQKQAAAVVT